MPHLILDFMEYPKSQVVEYNEEAVFRCRHESSDTIGWSVNKLPSGQFPDITPGSINENGTMVHTLTIPGRSDHSGKEVVCVAFMLRNRTSRPNTEETPPVNLTVMYG